MRIDGVLYEEGGGLIPDNASGLALVPNNRRSSAYIVDTQAGRFSASGAVGLAGHVENFFLATYLRDFNRIVPLTTESSVTEGMLEVLSPAVSSRGLSQTSPIPQPESRRQAKLAVFWGVVAMGSRILNAEDEATARYLSLMRAALRECFDSNDKEASWEMQNVIGDVVFRRFRSRYLGLLRSVVRRGIPLVGCASKGHVLVRGPMTKLMRQR